MIRIRKPAKIPRMLTDKGRGPAQTQSHCDEFDTNRQGFLDGDPKMCKKDGTIYRSQSVLTALRQAQHNKCCYCERRRERIEIDVEHFRPKSAVKQARGATDLFPGYYWLAYDWDNLYLACKMCNTGNKGILFPLADDTRRARWHGDTNRVEDEEPLFINPGFENPSDHLRFKRDAPEAKTRKGKITIQELDLASEKESLLKEARLEKIDELEQYCAVVQLAAENLGVAGLNALSERAKQSLRAAVQPSAEFSLMAANFIEDYFAAGGILVDFLD